MDQNRDLKLFYKKYVGEEILNRFISYSNTKSFSPFENIELRHKVDHITLKKIQFFDEYRSDPAIARLFTILIRQREIKKISNGKNLQKLGFYKKDNSWFKRFYAEI